MKKYRLFWILFGVVLLTKQNSAYGQCSEENDAEITKYMQLTLTKNAQSCSQCASLSVLFCNAKYCTDASEKQKMSDLIRTTKENIKQMGEPYCCPEYLNKNPEWGIMEGTKTHISDFNNEDASGEEVTQELIMSFTKQLKSNPENPLNINNEFLTNLSTALPEGNFKNLLNSYSTNLGKDQNLNMRQVYWDVSTAFDRNPTIAKMDLFSSTNKGLNLIYDNALVLSNSLKSSEDEYQFGSFISNPEAMSSLTNLTGSYEAAQAIGLGVEVIAQISQNRANQEKLEKDYVKLAPISAKNVYLEKDIHLNSALIDAFVGIEGHLRVTPIFRYDFKNGASIRVENGILKFLNPRKQISKNLLVVDKKNDGKYHKYKELRDRQTNSPAILISGDEKVFYISANEYIMSDINCIDCLKPGGYVFNTETGEIIFSLQTNKYWKIPHGRLNKFGKLDFAHFDKDNNLLSIALSQNVSGSWIVNKNIFRPEHELKEKDNVTLAKLDNKKEFKIQKSDYQLGRINVGSIFFDPFVQFYHVFEKDNHTICLLWAHTLNNEYENKMFSSSMVQINKDKEHINLDHMVNELTGLTMTRNGSIYFTSQNGKIGKLNSTEYKINDPNIAELIRKKLTLNHFETYDFIASRQYTSEAGHINNSNNAVTFDFNTYPTFPILKFTPDEKFLVYTVNDNLYVIDTLNLNKSKHYKLTGIPYDIFFAKENGDWIIHIQTLDDYKFPITKKYSLEKLSKINTDIIQNKSTKFNEKSSSEKPINSNMSVADEIKKLKELLDIGALSKEEFETAKKQLLNK